MAQNLSSRNFDVKNHVKITKVYTRKNSKKIEKKMMVLNTHLRAENEK